MSQRPAVVTRIARETPTILSFSVRPLDGDYRYLAGQWAELRTLDHGREIMGGYSMTSSPATSGTLDFAVKASRKHDFTRWLHERARVGDALTLGPAMGTFVFEAGMADELVLIGGGVGVTPLISILREAKSRGKLTLLYSMATPEEYLFRAELEATARDHPNLRLAPIVTGTDVGDWQGRRGRIDAKLLGEHLGGAGTLYYLCGPPGMVEDMIRLLGSLGVPEQQVVYEKWW
jgi:ferredoxin-NADP reductase